MTAYAQFLARKGQANAGSGFAVNYMPDAAFPFQQSLIEWSVGMGRCAIFADCGLGKTLMQLAWAENVVRHTGRAVLICTPLAVASQTCREAAKFGIEAVQSRDGQHRGGIVVTNYERLHHFDAADFVGVVCDESSILKNVGGATRKHVTRFLSKLPYRLLCTATAAPNDYVELGTSSEALGELSHSDMLKRFFKMLDDKGQKSETKDQEHAERLIEIDHNYYQKLAYRVAQTIGQWRLKHHAVTPFWKWVASWARACRRPSDLGFSDDGYVLPNLIERDHTIVPKTRQNGRLFNMPALGMAEERDERRRTLDDRCEFVAQLVDHDRPAVIWCHMNEEGDRLEELIPNSIQIAGKHTDEYKIKVAEWFSGERCICNDGDFRAKLATWPHQNENPDTGRRIIEPIVKSALLRLCNTQPTTESPEGNTSQCTTATTKANTAKRRSRKKNATESAASCMPPTSDSNSRKNKQRKIIEIDTQTLASLARCENMDQLLMNMCVLCSWDVQSAEDQKELTRAAIDFISIMITQPESSADCCAASAILGSANLTTIRNAWKRQHCICGHASGNRKLVTKSKIFGWGMNWQHCSHVVTFPSHSYEQYYQSVRRCYRFGQTETVRLDVVATDGEIRVLGNLRAKAKRADAMFSQLVEHMQSAVRVELVNNYTNRVEVPSWL